MRIPADMARPAGRSTRHELHFFDGNRRVVYTVNENYEQNNGAILITRTDAHGIITHTNRIFTEVCGYSAQELIGAPHYIIRHPDMPRAAFREMWQTVTQGKEWHGYVKDGRYYWVYATIVPIIEGGRLTGCTSARRKVDAATIGQYEALYRNMRHQESLDDAAGVAENPAPAGKGGLFARLRRQT